LCLKENPEPIDIHRKIPNPQGIHKKVLSDDLYAPILTHLRELSQEEKDER